MVRGGEVEAVEARRKRSDMELPCRLNRQRATLPELPSSSAGILSLLLLFRVRLPPPPKFPLDSVARWL